MRAAERGGPLAAEQGESALLRRRSISRPRQQLSGNLAKPSALSDARTGCQAPAVPPGSRGASARAAAPGVRGAPRSQDRSRPAPAATCHRVLATTGPARRGPSHHSCNPGAALGRPVVTPKPPGFSRGHVLVEPRHLGRRDRAGEARVALASARPGSGERQLRALRPPSPRRPSSPGGRPAAPLLQHCGPPLRH